MRKKLKKSFKRKRGQKEAFYAKEREVERDFYSQFLMIILLYKKTYFNANNLNFILLNVFKSFFLQEFNDVLDDIFHPKAIILNCWPIGAILRRKKSF